MNGLVGEDRTRKYDPKAREKHPIYAAHTSALHGLQYTQLYEY